MKEWKRAENHAQNQKETRTKPFSCQTSLVGVQKETPGAKAYLPFIPSRLRLEFLPRTDISIASVSSSLTSILGYRNYLGVHSMKVRVSLIALTVLSIVYAADDLSVRYRIPRGRQPFGSVTVERYDAISEKNNKTEFVYEDPVVQTCLHSLFPHLGYAPCWYLSRHREQRVNY